MAVAIDKKQESIIARYQTLFQLSEQQMNGYKNHPLHQIRRKAMEKLSNNGFPARKDEDYKYTNISRLVKGEYSEGKGAVIGKNVVNQTTISQMDTYHLVFVNGVLNKGFSKTDNLCEGLTIQSVTEAYENPDTQALVEATVNSEKGQNAFVQMNTAFAKNGIFIHVAKNRQVDKPILITHITVSGGAAIFTNPQTLIIAEAGSELTFIENFRAINDGSYFTNSVTRITAGKNARVSHYKLQNESVNANQINNTIATQERDSTYSSYVLDLGGGTVRNNLSSHLLDTNTQTNFYGVYLANGEQHIDNQTFIDHAFPHCESNELYKGILDDRGRGVFNGKVNVAQDAQKTNAFQQSSSLVISDNAVMNSKPQLEIFADDVRCSHGATIGQLDETAIYYLRTRGMTPAKARSILQFAFLAEVLESFPLEPVREQALAMVNAKLG